MERIENISREVIKPEAERLMTMIGNDCVIADVDIQ